jgi:predicted transcriptional regulator of viral defense system
MSLQDFFATHPVFTVDEVEQYQYCNGSTSRWTRKALLAYHCKQGHIIQVRRGMYAAVPAGMEPETFSPDPYLITAKMSKDAVLAFHTALDLQGSGYSVFHEYYFLTLSNIQPVEFRGIRFQSVRFPKVLWKKRKERFGVKEMDHYGVNVNVTTLERTLVDLLHRPDFGGGWEEIWRSLEMVAYFDLERVVEYALLLENATTIAKVGYFLQENSKRLMVEAKHLVPLQKQRPKQPHYMDKRYSRHSRLIREWNLIVPDYVADRMWEEPG